MSLTTFFSGGVSGPAPPPPEEPEPFTLPLARTETLTFRDSLQRIVPRWLHGPTGGGLLYAIGIHLDALQLMAAAAVRRRFPGYDGYNDEIEPLGRERRIRRGRAEPDVSYGNRMLGWLDDHRMRGGPYAMLRQLHGYYTTGPRAIDLVYENGRRYHMAPDGTVTRDIIPWIAPTARPWRYWVIINWTEGVPDDGTWASPGTWDDGGAWDYGLSGHVIEDSKTVPQDWQPANALGYVVLLPPEVTDITSLSTSIWDNNFALSALGIARFVVPA